MEDTWDGEAQEGGGGVGGGGGQNEPAGEGRSFWGTNKTEQNQRDG